MKADSSAIPEIAGVQPVQRFLRSGESLFRRGDRSFGMFFLFAGRISMQRVTSDGGRIVLHVAQVGETFAEASLFSDRYHCDAIAELDCRVGIYPKKELARRFRDDPAGLWEFAAALARQIQQIRGRYELKQIRSAPERVLQFLRLRCDASGVYRLERSLKDMAVELGLSHEALYRALSALAAKGNVIRHAGHLRLASGTDVTPLRPGR